MKTNFLNRGLSLLKEEDVINVNKKEIQKDKPKVIIGSGTGFGQSYLTKSKFSPYYEQYPAEVCATEWVPKSDQEHKLVKYLKD